ncbi:predicted protein [Arabidopsis lyrata subsp. lyrata]|uniref:Predicted protein n=1 Tax=Arabidopsis lyrata subsp. lyrata TaxID=81972 RepID=D7LDF9_ARALL|nr:predicted protein [Arabidopsis lyrata subsp. lyrata]EFH57039.1 predicted protein [Arabidopsis lyrata subsp. lyrata]
MEMIISPGGGGDMYRVGTSNSPKAMKRMLKVTEEKEESGEALRRMGVVVAHTFSWAKNSKGTEPPT